MEGSAKDRSSSVGVRSSIGVEGGPAEGMEDDVDERGDASGERVTGIGTRGVVIDDEFVDLV